MSQMVLFVGTYAIPEGAVDAFRAQAQAMTELIRDHEPRVLLVGHFLSDDHPKAQRFISTPMLHRSTPTWRSRAA